MSRYRQPYSLYKRGKYWYYRTYSPNGIRTTAKSTGQTSKAMTQKYCDSLYLVGKLYDSGVTFGNYAARFYDDNGIYFNDRSNPLSVNTRKNYQRLFNLYIFPYFKDIKLNDINYIMLKSFRVDLLNTGKKPGSVVSIMNVLKNVLNYAYREELITDNPFNKLEALKNVENERDAFTLEEVRVLYKSLSEEFRPFILLLALTGMRISEASGVRDNDIIESEDFIYIHLDKQLINKNYEILKSKNGVKLFRDIPIIPELKSCVNFDPSRLSTFYRYFVPIEKSFEKSDERNLAIHSLRHFFITNAKSKNVNPEKVEILAGHSLKKVRKTYTNFKVYDLLDILEWQKETYNLIIAD